jgi:hypothetical protein
MRCPNCDEEMEANIAEVPPLWWIHYICSCGYEEKR